MLVFFVRYVYNIHFLVVVYIITFKYFLSVILQTLVILMITNKKYMSKKMSKKHQKNM